MKVNLFTSGDSFDINTWSAAPYYIAKALILNQVEVNRINLGGNKYVNKLYNLVYGKWINLFYKIFKIHKTSNYTRTRFYYWITNLKIKRICKNSQGVDYNVFLSYSFSSHKYSNIPVVLICDQSYQESLKLFNAKKCNNHSFLIKIQKNNFHNAFRILPLNMHSYTFIKENFADPKIFLIASSIIKLEYENDDLNQSLVELKLESKDILFIGSNYHTRGVDILIEAFNRFNEKMNHEYKLHIVGSFKDAEMPENKNIIIHGFLDRSKPQQLKIYIDLLKSARLFVFPMRQGPLPGVIMEANLFYTPVIISDIFGIEQFIQNGYNGVLVKNIDAPSFASEMERLIKNTSLWLQLAHSANQSAQKHTAKAYGGALLNCLHENSIIK